MSFQETSLWKNAFEGKKGSEKEKAEKLALAFIDFRDKSQDLADEIPKHLPGLTVHDITHLDALWEMATLIGGDNLTLTPTEAFVLGGAFLTHDLAMSVAAYSEGFKEIENTDQWKDIVYKYLSKKIGRQPTDTELSNPSQDIIEKAQQEVLRDLHAIQAERLATQKWTHERLDYDQFLIDNSDLRQDFGSLIGRLAHSHWWSIERIEEEFSYKLGAPGHFPALWDIDPLKLACLLRVADASHIDDRRAPTFLYAIRKPQGLSLDHWNFQNLLNRPTLDNERLQYTSKRPFKLDESKSWWICFDTLTMIDEELRHVDSLLVNKGRDRLSAKGVQATENADYLKKYIRVDGWEPVDTRIKVGDVAKLAKNLGGKQLYGNDRLVPLRELIQNASDAIRARRKFENRSVDFGDVTVRLGVEPDCKWLEVEDNGIGMSPEVLKGPFLDFGTSYWGSSLMMREWPGLLSSEFEATGQFGIGFFSVFMWGNRVEVKTRRCVDARSQTNVLTFLEGLNSRPILRSARPSEQMLEAGTRIRIYLNDEFDAIEKIKEINDCTFDRICMWLCPTIDVNLFVEDDDKPKHIIVRANDWTTLGFSEICKRLSLASSSSMERYDKKRYIRYRNIIESTIKNIFSDSGRIVGRLSVLAMDDINGCITIGGLRGQELSDGFGFLLGNPTSAKRNAAEIIVTRSETERWAEEQSDLLSTLDINQSEHLEISSKLISLIGKPGNLKIAGTLDDWKNCGELSVWLEKKSQVILLPLFFVHVELDNLNDLSYTVGKSSREHPLPISNTLIFYPKEVTQLINSEINPVLSREHIEKGFSHTSLYITNMVLNTWKIDRSKLFNIAKPITVRGKDTWFPIAFQAVLLTKPNE